VLAFRAPSPVRRYAAAVTSEAEREQRRGRVVAFGLTWLSYATYYFGRKGISVSKKPIASELGESALVGVDTAYLTAYAIGQGISGWFGDRVGASRLLGFGMLLSAACCAAFGAGSTALVFLIAFGVNGLAQSTGWPGNVKAMAEWTPPSQRGAVMGVWATCYQAGGLAATAFAALMLRWYGWRAAFWAPALLLLSVGLLVMFFLKRGPELKAVGARASAEEVALSREEVAAARRHVLRSPLVWLYGGSYFFIKLIRYSLLFWLPYYLETELAYSTFHAGVASTAFDAGGIVGTLALGLVSDRFRRLSRSAWSALSLVMLAVAVLLYARLGAIHWIVNIAVMASIGALLFGPDALLTGAGAQDAGGARGAAIAAGTMNAIGSLGAIFQELVIRGVSKQFGWNGVFYAFIAFALAAALMLVPTFFLRQEPRSSSTA
jgi:MFS transporter, OPA family, sugar phosphate sensor protein UhpC